MHLARPHFRPRRIICALVLAYFTSGFLYQFARQVERALQPYGDGAAAMLVLPGFFIDAWVGIVTLITLGFPIIDTETREQGNLYPVIIPVALLFLVIATGAVRFGRKQKAADPS